MKRSRIREHIFILVYMMDFYPEEEMSERAEKYFDNLDEKVGEKNRTYMISKFLNILGKTPELDKMIEEKAEGWSLGRMGRAELSIIRLAVYEIMFDDDVPTGVAINEAVELAKSYGQDEAAAFVNGVLAKFA